MAFQTYLLFSMGFYKYLLCLGVVYSYKVIFSSFFCLNWYNTQSLFRFHKAYMHSIPCTFVISSHPSLGGSNGKYQR